MGYVKQFHKESGITYVYENHSYWDPEKKQSRSKRKLIGKLDKETGEIIPTAKNGGRRRGKKQPVSDAEKAAFTQRIEEMQQTIKSLELECSLLRNQIAELEKSYLKQLKEYNESIERREKLDQFIGKIVQSVDEALDEIKTDYSVK